MDPEHLKRQAEQYELHPLGQIVTKVGLWVCTALVPLTGVSAFVAHQEVVTAEAKAEVYDQMDVATLGDFQRELAEEAETRRKGSLALCVVMGGTVALARRRRPDSKN